MPNLTRNTGGHRPILGLLGTAVALGAGLAALAPSASAATASALGTAADGARAPKILRVPATTNGPGTLDPVMGSTTYENRAASCLYETLLEYRYLTRPLELQPLLLERMPEVSADGKTWRFTLRPDVRFHDDACFPGGRGRPVTTADVFYWWKRLADPDNRYKNWWLVDGIIEGFNEYRDAQMARAEAGSPCDYDAPVSGFRTIDDRTFEVVLTENNQQFIWRLAMFQLSIVPREAVEMYGTKFAGRPVGTGPFILAEESDWERGVRLTVRKNPNYREAYYPTVPESQRNPEDAALGLYDAAGQRLPLVDAIEHQYFVESQPMWLKFQAGKLDFTTVPSASFDEAFIRRTKRLKRAFRARDIRDVKVPLLDFIFRAFNMEDELMGGYTDEKRALRQAFNLAMDWEETNETLYNGMTVLYDGPIPPGLDGHPTGEDARAPFSTRGPNYELARQKLRDAGYTVVDGKVTDLPVIDLYTSTGQESVRIVELMMRHLAEVGIQINPRYVEFPVLMQTVDNRKAPIFSFAWGSDYPDAENNLALFYSPNASPGSNHSNYNNPEYDRLYEQIRTMPAGPERTKIYEQMRDILIRDAPFAGSMARTRQYLIQPWLLNFKPTEDFFSYFKYLDLDQSDDRRPE